MARPVFIVDGSRTPFLKARSGPGPFTPVDYAAFFTESGARAMHARHVPETVFFRWAIKELTNVVRPDDPLLVRYRDALERLEKQSSLQRR